ncbi:MAG TPA: ATP-dependent DNA helicase [Candidatus Saccharimonadales bacterium]
MSFDFKKAYSGLNKAQKEAVDNIDGPVMVIAGPGTGKTQLLSLRVANILLKTDVNPENILCLTFSDSAANEMRQRLATIIGLDAYKVNVSTYHSFGSDLIASYPAYFNNYARLMPLSDLAADIILRKIQATLSYKNPYKDERLSSNIKRLISEAKRALLSPDDIDKVIKSNLEFIGEKSKQTKTLGGILARVSKTSKDDFLVLKTNVKTDTTKYGFELLAEAWDRELDQAIGSSIESGDNKALSKWKTKFLSKDENGDFIAAGLEQNERLSYFCDIYRKYLAELAAQGLYDFDDMILRSIEALNTNLDLKYTIQEKYQYLLLDEYQDTNQAQAKLVELLSDNPINEGRPNVMAVGDDDQAIFVFQGAKYSHMLDFINLYHDVRQVTLKENYRSSSDIIKLSGEIASQIESRLTKYLPTINKDFVAAGDSKDKSGIVKRLDFERQTNEYAWISQNIKKDNATDFGDIAIIAPKHKYLETLVPYLQASDIPISYERRENILQDPVILELLNFCRAVNAINQKKNSNTIDALLAVVLNYDFWNLPTDTVWQISWAANKKRIPWIKELLANDSTRLIGLLILKLSANAGSLKFDFLIEQILGLSEVTIIDKQPLIYRSPFYDFYKSSGAKPELAISQLFTNLVSLRNQFKDYNAVTTKPLLISDFIEFIDEMNSSGLKILNQSSYNESNNSVQLMTAFKAKGQEFKTVYVVSAIDEVWGPSARSNNSRISLPPNLSYISYQTRDIDEKLRLLYVALTRAKQNVYITSYGQTDNYKPTKPLVFLNEQTAERGQTISPYLPAKANQVEQLELASTSLDIILNWQHDYKPIKLNSELIDILKPRLENYQLSPTELNSFLDVRNAGPQNFYNRSILKYPSPVGPLVDYGSAIHESLDWLQKQLIVTTSLPKNADLLEQFKLNLTNRRLDETDFKNLLARGQETIANYYLKNKKDLSSDDSSEFSFRNEGAFVGDAHLSGSIDRLIVDKANKTIVIVDYKTGKSYQKWTSEAKLHLYSNQLYFYKLLVENSVTFKNYRVSGAYLDFVEPDLNGQLNKLYIDFNDQQTNRLKLLIKSVWKRIHSLDFPDVSSYPADLKGIIAFEDYLIGQ